MTEASTVDNAEMDALVLELRCAGRSFPTIARTLGLARPDDANAAFVRAVRRRPVRDRDRLCRDEMERLDLLEARVRDDRDLAPFDRDVQLERVARLRARLVEAGAP